MYEHVEDWMRDGFVIACDVNRRGVGNGVVSGVGYERLVADRLARRVVGGGVSCGMRNGELM